MLLHMVLYQPRPGLSSAEVAGFRSALSEARDKITSVGRVFVGRTIDLGIGYEHRSEGQSFDYVAIFEFASAEGLREYMAHPAHVALAEQFWKYCERTMILDVEAEDPTLS